MLKPLIQRIQIDRGARLVNEVNRLYKVGEVKKAERLKKKLTKDPNKLYWIMQRSYQLRMIEK